jgi:hypothetical protein
VGEWVCLCTTQKGAPERGRKMLCKSNPKPEPSEIPSYPSSTDSQRNFAILQRGLNQWVPLDIIPSSKTTSTNIAIVYNIRPPRIQRCTCKPVAATLAGQLPTYFTPFQPLETRISLLLKHPKQTSSSDIAMLSQNRPGLGQGRMNPAPRLPTTTGPIRPAYQPYPS